MRIATYARVSTRDGRRDTENQLRQLRQFAATQGWTVVHEFEDQASGKPRRPRPVPEDVRGGVPARVRLLALLEP
jgi:DNA invertase Pin-like site-specific DNA recombinase